MSMAMFRVCMNLNINLTKNVLFNELINQQKTILSSNLTSRYVHRSTRKKRTTFPFRWWAKKENKLTGEHLTKENKEFLTEYSKEIYNKPSPLKIEQTQLTEWTPDSKRCGLIARKIGVYPIWLKNGKRILCTLLQVNDNHVIKAYTANEYQDKCIYQMRYIAQGYGCMIIGAEGASPTEFTAEYCGLFNEAGVSPKKKLTRMLVTDDALLQPGTPLSINHLRVGDYVDCYGKTIEQGFQGVMKRWNFKGLPERNTTKARRRPGSICIGRKKAGPHKGKKLPGHMGSKWVNSVGLKIWRINTKYNVLYVHGPAVPGSVGNWIYVHDSKVLEKQFKEDNPPPFPTYFPENENEKELPENVYHPDVFQFGEPTIVFVETEEEKKAARVGAKLAKVRPKK